MTKDKLLFSIFEAISQYAAYVASARTGKAWSCDVHAGADDFYVLYRQGEFIMQGRYYDMRSVNLVKLPDEIGEDANVAIEREKKEAKVKHGE